MAIEIHDSTHQNLRKEIESCVTNQHVMKTEYDRVKMELEKAYEDKISVYGNN